MTDHDLETQTSLDAYARLDSIRATWAETKIPFSRIRKTLRDSDAIKSRVSRVNLDELRALAAQGLTQTAIASRLRVSRTRVSSFMIAHEITRKAVQKTQYNADAICQLYRAGTSPSGIAKLSGKTTTAVKKILTARAEMFDDADIISAYREGLTMMDVAEKFKTSHYRVRTVLIKNKIPRRPPEPRKRRVAKSVIKTATLKGVTKEWHERWNPGAAYDPRRTLYRTKDMPEPWPVHHAYGSAWARSMPFATLHARIRAMELTGTCRKEICRISGLPIQTVKELARAPAS